MNTHYRCISEAARRIGDAIDRSVEALKRGRIEHEPAMTDRMLGAIEESLALAENHEVKWTAKTLTDRGRGSQESKVGADFMGVLQIKLPDYSVAKGFLAQAKLIRDGKVTGVSEMRRQCEKMLKHSSESFLFLYGTQGVRVVSALAVVSSDLNPTELYSKTARRFYTDHLECFVGDRSIQAATPEMIKDLRARYNPRALQLIKARWRWDDEDDESI